MASKAAAKPGRSRRDNFTATVLQTLFKRSGGKCCMCNAPTFGPMSNNPNKSVNIGKGAHIAAAAPGGPRYDPKMSPEERASASNGMWMCSNCHDTIDRDTEGYPVGRLRTMKREAEKRAKLAMGVGSAAKGEATDDPLTTGISAIAIVEVRKAKATIIALNGEKIQNDNGEEILDLVAFINPQLDNYLPQVGQELMLLYELFAMHCASGTLVMEVLRRIKTLADSFSKQWSESDLKLASSVGKMIVSQAHKRTRVYQSGVALLKDLSSYSTFKEKGWHKIPAGELKSLRSVDLVDWEPEIKKPRLHTMAGGPPPINAEDSESKDMFLELMEKLANCENESQVTEIEQLLFDQGFEPEVN